MSEENENVLKRLMELKAQFQTLQENTSTNTARRATSSSSSSSSTTTADLKPKRKRKKTIDSDKLQEVLRTVIEEHGGSCHLDTLVEYARREWPVIAGAQLVTGNNATNASQTGLLDSVTHQPILLNDIKKAVKQLLQTAKVAISSPDQPNQQTVVNVFLADSENEGCFTVNPLYYSSSGSNTSLTLYIPSHDTPESANTAQEESTSNVVPILTLPTVSTSTEDQESAQTSMQGVETTNATSPSESVPSAPSTSTSLTLDTNPRPTGLTPLVLAAISAVTSQGTLPTLSNIVSHVLQTWTLRPTLRSSGQPLTDARATELITTVLKTHPSVQCETNNGVETFSIVPRKKRRQLPVRPKGAETVHTSPPSERVTSPLILPSLTPNINLSMSSSTNEEFETPTISRTTNSKRKRASSTTTTPVDVRGNSPLLDVSTNFRNGGLSPSPTLNTLPAWARISLRGASIAVALALEGQTDNAPTSNAHGIFGSAASVAKTLAAVRSLVTQMGASPRPPSGICCAQCGTAHSRSPKGWYHGPTLFEWHCGACGEKYSREHACPLCGLVYEDVEEEEKMERPLEETPIMPARGTSTALRNSTTTTATATTTTTTNTGRPARSTQRRRSTGRYSREEYYDEEDDELDYSHAAARRAARDEIDDPMDIVNDRRYDLGDDVPDDLTDDLMEDSGRRGSRRKRKRGSALPAVTPTRTPKGKQSVTTTVSAPTDVEPPESEGGEVLTSWIACDDCGRWVMTSCDGITDLSLYDDENPNHLQYHCPLCRGESHGIPRLFLTKNSAPYFHAFLLNAQQILSAPSNYSSLLDTNASSGSLDPYSALSGCALMQLLRFTESDVQMQISMRRQGSETNALSALKSVPSLSGLATSTDVRDEAEGKIDQAQVDLLAQHDTYRRQLLHSLAASEDDRKVDNSSLPRSVLDKIASLDKRFTSDMNAMRDTLVDALANLLEQNKNDFERQVAQLAREKEIKDSEATKSVLAILSNYYRNRTAALERQYAEALREDIVHND